MNSKRSRLLDSAKILITGGTGFIGSQVVRLFVRKYPHFQIFNLDALTCAGNPEILADIEGAENYTFLKADINDPEAVCMLFRKHRFDAVIHLAAESQLERSNSDLPAFVKTNLPATMNLLKAAKENWKDKLEDKLFCHISTDEIYEELGDAGLCSEKTPPNSSYSASKASSDRFVRAYGKFNDLPYIITNCSNDYGPNEFSEKPIPVFIHHITSVNPLSLYGDGKYTQDWLYAIDHASAIELIFFSGGVRETYNIGGFDEWQNMKLVKVLRQLTGKKLSRSAGTSKKLFTHGEDRPGHDNEYAIDALKITGDLDPGCSVTFEERAVNSGEHSEICKHQYQ